jgi:pimeloyl-ACP methyl ester carboxylesterase
VVLEVFLILFSFLLLALGLLLWTPGKPKPFLDENGRPLPRSISEKIWVKINGVEQGMFIKSKDSSHPVLLYLHGGMPDYFLTERYPIALEDDFTVVWWDRRGVGLSYSPAISPETLTVEQMISDTMAVTNYLRERFGQEKIYLMGHSGGTFIAIQAAAQAPHLYHAYIGVAQMSDQLKSEKLAYDYMLQQFTQQGNRAMVRKLEAAPVTMAGGTPDAYLAVRDDAMHRLGIGTTHEMKSILTGIVLPSLTYQEYTFGEKVNLWRGKIASGVSQEWDKVLATDLSQEVPALDLPVYFFHGIYDYTCSYTLAKEYFDKLKAPVKGFYTFEHSAHSPIFEEADKAAIILRADVLAGTNTLADSTGQ